LKNEILGRLSLPRQAQVLEWAKAHLSPQNLTGFSKGMIGLLEEHNEISWRSENFHPGASRATWLTSDSHYALLRRYWREGKIIGVTGDILLQSFALGSLTKVQSAPVRLNSDTTVAWKFLPALRNSTSSGLLNVSWYDRRGLSGAMTAVWAARNVDPRTTTTPANVQITNAASDWNAASSDVVPNFGDYTDNYVAGTTLYVAWSDGRLGLPQPFASKQP